MAIKKRCIRCLQVLREDGTCQNTKCVKYVPEGVNEIPPEAEVEEVITQEKLDSMGEGQ